MKIWIAALCATVSLSAAVEDKIALFSAKTIKSADAELANIKAKTDKEILIMTLPDLGGKNITVYARDKAIEKKLNGAILVVSKAPRQLELIPGRRTALILTLERRQKVIDMLSKGLRAAPDKTLAEAVKYLSDLFLTADKALVQADQHDVPAPAASEPATNLVWLKWVLGAAGLLVVTALIFFWLRNKAKVD